MKRGQKATCADVELGDGDDHLTRLGGVGAVVGRARLRGVRALVAGPGARGGVVVGGPMCDGGNSVCGITGILKSQGSNS